MRAGCNVGSKTLLTEWGKTPLKSTCPSGTFTCPATLLNKGEDSAQNITCRVGLAQFPFFAKFTCNGASGYVARCLSQIGPTSYGRKCDEDKNSKFLYLLFLLVSAEGGLPGSLGDQGGFDGPPQPYKRGPPPEYLDRIAEKRTLEVSQQYLHPSVLASFQTCLSKYNNTKNSAHPDLATYLLKILTPTRFNSHLCQIAQFTPVMS